MDVRTVGSGDPEIAVVAGIHGDEPSGVRAIERVIAAEDPFEKAVKFVIANERALEANTRYIDTDLNRAFPGDPTSDRHEVALAAALSETLSDCLTLSLHATQSTEEPFALVDGIDNTAQSICPTLPISAVVDLNRFVSGRLFTALSTIEVECGRQGSEQAVDTAEAVIRSFLGTVGALPDRPLASKLPVYRLIDRIDKPDGDDNAVVIENFESVDAGEVFARTDEIAHSLDRTWYPVLVSADGYERIFGYAAEAAGVITPSGPMRQQ